MIATFIISFREFLEAFMIVGIFLGISKKLKLKRELEILTASIIGIFFSLTLATTTYYFSKNVQVFFNEKNTEIFENYLLIFSGLFLIYTVLSLHKILRKIQIRMSTPAQIKLQNGIFDISLFLMIIFLIFREGFEIALFTATTSLLSIFVQNFIGLVAGFIGATLFGLLIYFTYLKLPIKKVFKITEYIILALGIIMTINGLIKLLIH